jgi:hypothetical protein
VLLPIDAILQLFGRLTRLQVVLQERLHGFASSSTAELPGRMIRNGRPADQNFKQWHELYYRFESDEDIDGDRLLGPRIYTSFDISVNWSKYSKPWDVIFDHLKAGVALFS